MQLAFVDDLDRHFRKHSCNGLEDLPTRRSPSARSGLVGYDEYGRHRLGLWNDIRARSRSKRDRLTTASSPGHLSQVYQALCATLDIHWPSGLSTLIKRFGWKTFPLYLKGVGVSQSRIKTSCLRHRRYTDSFPFSTSLSSARICRPHSEISQLYFIDSNDTVVSSICKRL